MIYVQKRCCHAYPRGQSCLASHRRDGSHRSGVERTFGSGADKACITYLGLSKYGAPIELQVSALFGANHSLMANLREPESKLDWDDKDQG